MTTNDVPVVCKVEFNDDYEEDNDNDVLPWNGDTTSGGQFLHDTIE